MSGKQKIDSTVEESKKIALELYEFKCLQGDSGGGLICDSVVRGVVSWGDKCGAPKKPGVYVDVNQYREWIANNSDNLIVLLLSDASTFPMPMLSIFFGIFTLVVFNR